MPTLPKNGSDYAALQANNPYRDYQYTRGLWDNVGDWMNKNLFFGNQVIKTPEQKYRDEMANQARAYDAQIAEVAREEAYNSSAEQAARMRDAGINPDLQSSGITGGEASPMDNQAVMNLPQTNDDVTNTMSFVRGLVNLVPSVQSMLSALPQLKQSFSASTAQTATTLGAVNSYVDDWILHQYSTFSGIKDQKDFLNSGLFKKFMNDPQIKQIEPSYSGRKKLALTMFDRAKSIKLGTDVDSMRGIYLKGHTDPLNSDETLISMINKVTSEYLLSSAEYQRDLIQALDANDEAAAKNAANQWQALQDNAYIAMTEYLASMQEATGEPAYGLAIMQINLMQSGKLFGAAGLGLAGLGLEELRKLFGLKNPTEPSGEPDPVSGLTPDPPSEPPSLNPKSPSPTEKPKSKVKTVDDWLNLLFGDKPHPFLERKRSKKFPAYDKPKLHSSGKGHKYTPSQEDIENYHISRGY